MHSFRGSLALAFAVLIPAALGADTVIFTNGDRLTGTVRRLAEGTLVLQSKLAGTVEIEWENIQKIDTDASFSILTVDGRRLDGRLSRDEARTTVVREGSPEVAIHSDAVARIARGEPEQGIRKMISALDGSADIGYSVARGNQNQAQSSAGATAGYTSAQYKFSGRLSSLFARQDGARSQSRHAINARLDRFVNVRSFAYALAGLERNERRLLDLRSRFGGGMGWRLRASGNTKLSMLGGVAYVHERLRDQNNRATVESFAGLEWATVLFGKVQLETNFTLHPNLLDVAHLRVEYDGTFRVPIAGRFNYSLRLFDRFDTRPAETVARNDYGIVSGLGVVF